MPRSAEPSQRTLRHLPWDGQGRRRACALIRLQSLSVAWPASHNTGCVFPACPQVVAFGANSMDGRAVLGSPDELGALFVPTNDASDYAPFFFNTSNSAGKPQPRGGRSAGQARPPPRGPRRSLPRCQSCSTLRCRPASRLPLDCRCGCHARG